MGAVLMADHVYQAIANASPLPVGHGFTYSGHPVSAAVGLEVLRLYREGGLLDNGRKTGRRFAEHMARITDHPLVGDARWRGMLGAIELVSDRSTKTAFDPALDVAGHLGRITWDNGLIVRCFPNAVIGFAPALCCSEDEMDQIFDRLSRSLDQLLAMPDVRAALA
jgi:adenosylmethionine-8-amino-7-oxononanoate aminotransferase